VTTVDDGRSTRIHATASPRILTRLDRLAWCNKSYPREHSASAPSDTALALATSNSTLTCGLGHVIRPRFRTETSLGRLCKRPNTEVPARVDFLACEVATVG
jgi:hypothetical protein